MDLITWHNASIYRIERERDAISIVSLSMLSIFKSFKRFYKLTKSKDISA